MKLSLEVVEKLDCELARLGRGAVPIRLRLGDAIEALGRSAGHEELGFGTMALYARERCERSGRYAEEARAMSRRLAKLPLVRAAMETGRISWSMGDVLSRRATPEDEARLVEEAKLLTVRQMKKKLETTEVTVDEDDEVPMRTVTVTVPTADAWALEAGRMLVAAIEGFGSDEVVVSSLLGEAESTMIELLPGVDFTAEKDEARRAAEYRATMAAWRREAEERAEDGLSLRVEPFQPAAVAPLPTTPRGLDSLIRKLCADLAARDAEMGEMALRLFDANGWRRLGYASEGQYARERLGCSVASLRARMTLARRMGAMPAIRDAMVGGEIGMEAASLVARVSTQKTVGAWIERSKVRTILFLRKEVEIVEMLARANGDPGALEQGPPEDELVEAMQEIEGKVLSGRVFQMSVGQQEKSEPVEAPEPSEAKLRPGAGMTTVRLRVTEDTYWQWKALTKAYRRTRFADSFVAFLAKNFWFHWRHVGKMYTGLARKVLERDLYRCSSPVCGKRWVEIHHLIYRSHGGTDELENCASLCPWCHHRGIHESRLKALPPASKKTWYIGREPIMVIFGRERRLIPPGACHGA